MKTRRVVVRSARPQSVSSNQNNRWEMKSATGKVLLFFVTDVNNEELIEALPFDLGGEELRCSSGIPVVFPPPDFNLDVSFF